MICSALAAAHAAFIRAMRVTTLFLHQIAVSFLALMNPREKQKEKG
jgi:hypothetical protein